MQGVTQYNSTTWGTALIGVSNFYISDFTYQAGLDTCRFSVVGQFERGKIRMVQDGLDMRGGCHDGVIERARGNSTDDFIALNNIEYIWPVDSKFRSYEPIYNITFRDIFLDNSTYGIGIYSGALIDNIRIYNLYGKTQFNRAVVAGSNSALAGFQVNYQGGNIGSLFVDGINVTKGDSLQYFPYPQAAITQKVDFDGNMKSVTLKNFINPNEEGRAIVQEALAWPIEQLNIDGYYEVDTANGTTVLPKVYLAGVTRQLNVNNVNWTRRAGTTQKGVFATINTAYRHSFNNMRLYNIDTAIVCNGGSGKITLNNITMDSCDANGGILSVTQASPAYTVTTGDLDVGVSKALVGAGAAFLETNRRVTQTVQGNLNISDPRGSAFRGIEFDTRDGFGQIWTPSGSDANVRWGVRNNANTRILTALWAETVWNGSDNILSATYIGEPNVSFLPGDAAVRIAKQDVITNKLEIVSAGGINLKDSVRISDNLNVAANGANIVGNVSIQTPNNGQLSIYRSITTVGGLSSIKFDLQQANGTRVTLLEEGAEMTDNTTGAPSAAKVWYLLNGGTGGKKAQIWPNGNFTLQDGGVFANNGFRFEAVGTARITGNSYFGGTGSTTAKIHIAASNGTASSAQIKMDPSSLLSTPENNTVEHDANNWYGTTSNVRWTFAKTVQNTATLDFSNTSAQSSADLTITVTGAAVGDPVALAIPAAPDANSSYTAWVSASDTVTVRFNNYSAGAIDPASGLFRVSVIHY
jgi:hypothetical protein